MQQRSGIWTFPKLLFYWSCPLRLVSEGLHESSFSFTIFWNLLATLPPEHIPSPSACLHFCHPAPNLGLSSLFSLQQPEWSFQNINQILHLHPLIQTFPWLPILLGVEFKPITWLTKPCVSPKVSAFLAWPRQQCGPFWGSHTPSLHPPQRLCCSSPGMLCPELCVAGAFGSQWVCHLSKRPRLAL